VRASQRGLHRQLIEPRRAARGRGLIGLVDSRTKMAHLGTDSCNSGPDFDKQAKYDEKWAFLFSETTACFLYLAYYLYFTRKLLGKRVGEWGRGVGGSKSAGVGPCWLPVRPRGKVSDSIPIDYCAPAERYFQQGGGSVV